MGTDRSRTINMNVKYGPKSTSVSVSPSGEIVEDSSVTLTCSSDANPPVQSYTWYKKNLVYYPSTTYMTTGPHLVFNQIKSSDTGEYYCEAWNGIKTGRSESINIDVKYKPKSTSVSVSPSGEIVEGSSVTLTCSSDANPPVQSYTWWYKKNGGHYQSMTGPHHVLNQIQSSDTGGYYCESQNEMGTDRSRTINMDVKYGPKNTSVSVSPSGEIVEGSSVTLTCSSDANPPVDKYTWYKTNGGHYQSISNQNTGPQHVYNCEAWSGIRKGRSESINIDVKYAPRNTSVSVSPSGEIVEGSSVTLTCSSDANPPVDKYTWYKKNVTSPKASGQSYSITNIISEDRGEYYCEAQNGRGSMNSTALMIIVAGKQSSVLTAASVRPDCNRDTYTALNMRTTSPDYDTLASVHPDPNSDTYTPLNMKTRSPEYDTLANVRGISH
ncbi:B-cell receptor CD22-like [Salvelinus alpinus]|uniref:B-cell receptor CD22-like n=1 Tax=Salvelinus alpinus TaxID=8036 RepID=UPI0039FBAA81